MTGPLEAALLQDAVQALVDRHASLRAGFWHAGLSRPVQVIVSRAAVPWRLIDLSMLDEAGQAAEVARLIAADRVERFDVASPPLLRFALIRLAADRHRLLLSNHHLLMDGWSAPVLVRELLTLYGRHGEAAVLPRVTPYRDYLGWLLGQDRAAARAAWRAALSGVEEATRLAPPARDRGAVAPEQLELSLGGELSAGLAGLSRQQALTLNTLVQVGFGVLLGRLTGRSDVVFGVTVSGRPAELPGVENMVGLFINTLPLRLRLPPQQRLIDLLRQTQQQQSELMAHQHLGLSELQQLAGVGELFDTLVVFENYPVDRAGLAAAAGSRLRLGAVRGHDATHYPLSLVVRPGAELRLRLDYRAELFERGSVVALAGRLVRLLAAAVAGPERALGGLEILAADERHTLLALWNATARAVPQATLPELLAAQAVRTPDAVAVVFGERRLSYAALQAHANRLAHHLRRLGVGPETVVGLCVERSVEMVIGLVGILNAGAAYLPLDPDYPPERLCVMLADAGAAVLVTQAALQERLERAFGGAAGAAGCRLAADRAAARHGAGVRPRPAGIRPT